MTKRIFVHDAGREGRSLGQILDGPPDTGTKPEEPWRSGRTRFRLAKEGAWRREAAAAPAPLVEQRLRRRSEGARDRFGGGR